MKAKEYAEMILSASTDADVAKALVDTVNGLFKEIGALIEARSIKMDKSVIPIYNDIDRKWRNICAIVNTKSPTHKLKQEGFAEFTRSKHTTLWGVVSQK